MILLNAIVTSPRETGIRAGKNNAAGAGQRNASQKVRKAGPEPVNARAFNILLSKGKTHRQKKAKKAGRMMRPAFLFFQSFPSCCIK